jgi:hypothetical protein
MVTNQTTEKLMELAWEYKSGLRNLEEAVAKGSKLSGFTPDLTEQFLRGLVRDNIMRIDFSEKTRDGKQARRTVGPGPKIKD